MDTSMAGGGQQQPNHLWFECNGKFRKVLEDRNHGHKLNLGCLRLDPFTIALNEMANLVDSEGWTTCNMLGLQDLLGHVGTTRENAIKVEGDPVPGPVEVGGGAAAAGPSLKRPRLEGITSSPETDKVIESLQFLPQALEANGRLQLPSGNTFFGELYDREGIVVTAEANELCNIFVAQVMVKGRRPQNYVVIGSPGVGKSCSAIVLLKRLCEMDTKPTIVFRYFNMEYLLLWTEEGGNCRKWSVSVLQGAWPQGAIVVSDAPYILEAPTCNHCIVFASPKQDNVVGRWKKHNRAMTWYHGHPTEPELEQMRTLDGYFERHGITAEMMGKMVKLVGYKPRLVLDGCVNENIRLGTLADVRNAVMAAKPDDVRQAAVTLSFDAASQLPSALFMLRPQPGHAEAQASFSSRWVAQLAALGLWLRYKDQVTSELLRTQGQPSLASYFGTLFECHALTTLARGVACQCRVLCKGDEQATMTSLQAASAVAAVPAAADEAAAAAAAEQADLAAEELDDEDKEAALDAEVLQIAAELLGSRDEAAQAVSSPASVQAPAQRPGHVVLGPFSLLLGTKKLSDLETGDLLWCKQGNPAIDGATGSGDLIQVTTAKRHPMPMAAFNNQAAELAKAGVEDLRLLWVVPPTVFEGFSKQTWMNKAGKKAGTVSSFAKSVKQLVVRLEVPSV